MTQDLPEADASDRTNEGSEAATEVPSQHLKVLASDSDALESASSAPKPAFAVPKSRPPGMAPPANRPPVPKFKDNDLPAVAAKSDTQKEEAFARALAISAAAKAASRVAPGQMDRAISQAAAAVANAYSITKGEARRKVETQAQMDGPKPASQPKAPADKGASEYEEPSWGAAPERAEFFLEVMKGGQIIGKEELKGKSHFKVGRIPLCDLVLQHPSTSRVHAILQFQGDAGPPKLYDMGSHGSFVNKKQVPPKTFAQLRVGDIIKFGQSTRMFILGGPEEMMPEEGLSRAQRHQLAALEAQERRKQREKEVAKAQMAAALNKGISWGMGGEDAFDPDQDSSSAPTVDWRAYSSTHSLTEKQQKLADKIRRLENRIRNLTTESDKIRVKQSGMEELSAGQAQTLARNERVIDTSTDDLEDLEEQLNNSIAESLRGKKNKLEADQLKSEKRKRVIAEPKSESESDEDDFYDRTSKRSRTSKDAKSDSQDPASIVGRKAALLGEAEKLRTEIKEEEESEKASGSGIDSAVALDSLDAFMTDVASTIEHSKVERMKKQLAELENEIQTLEVSLAQADPDGYYKEGTRAARLAKEKGIRLYNQEKDRKIVLEAKKRQLAAAKAEKDAAAQAFVPEEEDDPFEADAVQPSLPAAKAQNASETSIADVHANGLDLRPESQVAERALQHANAELAVESADAPQSSEQPSAGEFSGIPEPQRQSKAAIIPDQTIQTEPPKSAQESYGLQIMKKTERKPAAFAPSQAQAATGSRQTSELGSDGNIAPGEGIAEDDEAPLKAPGAENFVWKPPENQTGDGRTALNDKLGY